MPNSSEKSARFYSFIQSPEKLIADIRAKEPESLPTERLPMGDDTEALQARLDFLADKGHNFSFLTGNQPFKDYESLHGNIENFIGMSMVPTGVIGPLNILGTSARGDFYVPLATSEGALVASYDRGARATRRAGGITSICLAEGVQRSPVFKFRSIGEVGVFVQWVLTQQDEFRMIIGRTSNYAQLSELKMTIEGNHLILTFEYLTGDAAGQNMVTLCTDAICQFIVANSPQKPEYWFVEGNYSGDKKATALSFTNLRGKKVSAEVFLPRGIVESVLRTTPEAMANYWRSSTLWPHGFQGRVGQGFFRSRSLALRE
jgi:hydroxymethylglutaryl-CoA reductase (NADPH)